MRLEDIGFYTLEDKRAMEVSLDTPLWRCELLLTDVCNFACPYCKGVADPYKGHLSWDKAAFVVRGWAAHGLKNIRFSGGEPTLWKGGAGKGLVDIVRLARDEGIGRIAISTNGSVSSDYYERLLEAGVSDFSISLDSANEEIGDRMAGDIRGAWKRVVGNIAKVASKAYVTVGVVLTGENDADFLEIVEFAHGLGVSDIRVISSAQWNRPFGRVPVPEPILSAHPILKYRIGNNNAGRGVRGLREGDSGRCSLMLDDMAVLAGRHYACIIDLREGAPAVGVIDYSLSPKDAITMARKERADWISRVDSFSRKTCLDNCLDVCVDYNNAVRGFQGEPRP